MVIFVLKRPHLPHFRYLILMFPIKTYTTTAGRGVAVNNKHQKMKVKSRYLPIKNFSGVKYVGKLGSDSGKGKRIAFKNFPSRMPEFLRGTSPILMVPSARLYESTKRRPLSSGWIQSNSHRYRRYWQIKVVLMRQKLLRLLTFLHILTHLVI